MAKKTKQTIYKLTSRGSEAYGYFTGNGDEFVVTKGSCVSPDVCESFKKQTVMYAYRLFLETEHIVEMDGLFRCDHKFLSAAYAASIISGMSGRRSMWKLQE